MESAHFEGRQTGSMPKLVGFLLAFIALVVSLLTNADPQTCLVRAAVAFGVGCAAGMLWSGIFSGVHTVGRDVTVPELTVVESESPPEDQAKAA